MRVRLFISIKFLVKKIRPCGASEEKGHCRKSKSGWGLLSDTRPVLGGV